MGRFSRFNRQQIHLICSLPISSRGESSDRCYLIQASLCVGKQPEFCNSASWILMNIWVIVDRHTFLRANFHPRTQAFTKKPHENS